MMPWLRDQRLGLTAYWPLSSGLLTDKYRSDELPPPGSRGAGHSHIRTYPASLALGTEMVAVAEKVHAWPDQVPEHTFRRLAGNARIGSRLRYKRGQSSPKEPHAIGQ